MSPFRESVVKEATLGRLESAGWQVRNGADIAAGEPAVERDDCGQVVLAQRLRETFLPLAFVDLRIEGAEEVVGRAM